jgi:nucleoside-diphosphate-sugar epimerase
MAMVDGQSMKTAVTGGTGFMGSHLVEKLVSKGRKVRVLVRKTSDTKLLEKLRVELVYGDVVDKEAVERFVKDVDVVYHVAGRVYTGSKDEFWNVNFHGTENMLNACLNRSIDRFVYTSTIGVMGSIVNPPADESRPYNPSSPYDKSKCEAEKTALRYYRENGVPVTIVRPTVVYGPGNMYLLRLYQWIQRGDFPIIGSMNNLMHPCYIDNCLEGIMLAAEKLKAVGEVYIIGDEKPVTWREYVNEIAETMGLNPPDRHVPVWVIKAAAWLSEFKSWMFGTPPFLTRYWVEEITKNFAYDITKAKNELGYNPEISLKEGISRTIAWYRQNGFLR